MLKIIGPKTEKAFLSLLNLSQKYIKMISFDLAKHSKFESLKIAWRILLLRLLYSIFKASLLRHFLVKTLTMLWIKLNHIYASYYVLTIFRIFFHHYVNPAQRLLQVRLWKLKIWNKYVITKEIIVVLNWFIHVEVFIGKDFMKIKVFLRTTLFKLSTKTQ